jgi:Mn2+/Fe2+ NRAMP family transporter
LANVTVPRLGGLGSALRAIGPGIVVAGSVMGSGELIQTPIRAAQFGFVLLWAVLLSCVIKFFLQVEIARYTMIHRRTTFEALNQCPGPKIRGTSWISLIYMICYPISLATLVGIVGALAGLMQGIWPLTTSVEQSTQIWAVLMVLLAFVLLARGIYRHLELIVMVLVGIFSISLLIGVGLIQGTPYRFTADDVLSGLTFSFGADRELAAFAVISLLGALGVTANELFMYPYWILEKGYARDLGDPNSPQWTERARHWIRTVRVDAGVMTVLATIMTAAFYLLGAAVLHRQATVPTGLAVVDQISTVYTQSYGEWSKIVFLTGAFCVLFSTLVVVAAASGRMTSDFLCSIGQIDRSNLSAVRRCHQISQTGFLAAFLVGFLLSNSAPEWWVIAGQYFIGLFMTPLLMFGICWMAFHTDRRVRMNLATGVALLTSVVIILTCVVVSLLV